MKHLKVFALQVAAILTVGLIALAMGGCGNNSGVPQSVVDEHMEASNALLAENKRTMALVEEHSKVFVEYRRITQERILRLAADSARCVNENRGDWTTFTPIHFGVLDSLSFWIVDDETNERLEPPVSVIKGRTYRIEWGSKIEAKTDEPD
jgi:hypothetical protein